MHLLPPVILLANDVLLNRWFGQQTREDGKCFRDIGRNFRVNDSTMNGGLGLGLPVFIGVLNANL